MSFDKISIHDICLANFKAAKTTPEIEEWKTKNNIIVIESCARKLWLGTKHDFQDFPYNSSKQLLDNKNSYSFLLCLVNGIESRKVGETNITGQVFGAFCDFFEKIQNKKKDGAHLSRTYTKITTLSVKK